MFFIKYLRTLGFDITNDIIAENTWYFCNSLVRANYNDSTKGIHETMEYLELFLRNLLLGEHNPLHNRTLHISGAFKETEKPDIEVLKANIDNGFRAKTTEHILKLREKFQGQTIFGACQLSVLIFCNILENSSLMKKAKIIHALCHIVSVYFLEVCQVTWHL